LHTEQLSSWNRKAIRKNAAVCTLLLLIASFPAPFAGGYPVGSETGTLSIYFMQEQVGYEEYSWEEEDMGYTLTVKGRMTEPIAIEVERLVIRLDKSFIPISYFFKGRVGGVVQDIRSVFLNGKVKTTKQVADQERTDTAEIKRDAVLLPNPIFSPYMVLTKKYLCGLQESTAISAYIIPQMEVSATLQPKQDSPCQFVLLLGPTEIEISSDEEGILNGLDISAQSIKVVRTKGEAPTR
jgi:hypothetical protein